MEIITVQDPGLIEWVNDQLNEYFDLWDSRTIALLDDDRLLAVVLYSLFSNHGCQMTIASTNPRWCNRRFLREVFKYPFIQLGYKRVTFLTTPDNARCVALCKWLGAKQEGVMRKMFGDRDGILFGLLKEECRFIHGKIESAKSAACA